MQISFEETKDHALYQLGALFGFTKTKGIKIQHFKAHGALYNMAAIDENSYQTRDKNDKRKQSYKHKWQRN